MYKRVYEHLYLHKNHIYICIYRDREKQDQHVLIHMSINEDTGTRAFWVVANIEFRSLVELVDFYQSSPLTTRDGDEITLTVPLLPVCIAHILTF